MGGFLYAVARAKNGSLYEKRVNAPVSCHAVGIFRHRLTYTNLRSMNIHIDKSNGER
jgi:hypothetical protein